MWSACPRRTRSRRRGEGAAATTFSTVAGSFVEDRRLDRDRGGQPDRPDLADHRRAGEAPDGRIEDRLELATRSTSPSRSMMSRLAIAAAAAAAWPEYVYPWRNTAPAIGSSQNGARTRSPDEHAAERHVAGGHALGERDHVRLDPEALRAPHPARSARTR